MTIEEEEKQIRAGIWIKDLREMFTEFKIPMTSEDQIFVWSERFFWMGIINAMGSEVLPRKMFQMIVGGKSPVLDYKPKRIRKRKKQEKIPPDLLK
jgi:hypothetical protein